MDFTTKTITAGGSLRTNEYTAALLQDNKKLGNFRNQIAETKRRNPPLTAEDLRRIERRGNERKKIRPNHAPTYKVNIVRNQNQWEAFAIFRGGGCDWKDLIKQISWEQKGLLDSFLTWVLCKEGSRVGTYSTLQRYVLRTWAVYKKYGGVEIDQQVRHYGQRLALELAVQHGLRREPALKNSLGPGTFIYLVYFRIVRDLRTFNLGLDRLNDNTARIIQMFTGTRTHELVYEPLTDNKKLRDQYHDDDDAFDDIEAAIMPRAKKKCWVCGEVDERTMGSRQVLCWEDIFLWILRDPEGDGKDRLAMQILFRFHKGDNREVRPVLFLFVEEKLPLICPITCIIAKALAEGVIEISELDCAEKFFNTNLGLPAVQIYWKREFWHVPVFRKTEPCPDGYKVVDEPVTRAAFDNRTEGLGTDAGLPGKLQSYDSRRGQLQSTDTHYRNSIRNQTARHKPNSTVYETFYHNIRMNAVPQDAFMERGTSSPYPSILNYLGLLCDENAPTQVPDEVMQALGPNAEIRELEEDMSLLQDRLASKYGRASRATGPDKDEYMALQRRLATARQNYRDNVLVILRKDYFHVRNNHELQKQFQGNCERQGPKSEPIVFSLPERRRLAEIMGDLNEDLSREQVVRRKIDAINAWLDYVWKVEPTEARPPPKVPQQPPQLPAPFNTEASALPETVPSARPLMPRTPDTPPPSYTESMADSKRLPRPISEVSVPGRNTPRKQPDPCPWCGKTFSRFTKMWDHVEDKHLAHLDGGPVPCPYEECQARGSPFGYGHPFKSHMYHDHKVPLRPHKEGPGSEAGPNNVSGGTPTIVLTRREGSASDSSFQSSPGVKITLTVKTNRGCNDEVRIRESPRTPRIILKRKHSEEGLESPRKRRIVLKCK